MRTKMLLTMTELNYMLKKYHFSIIGDDIKIRFLNFKTRAQLHVFRSNLSLSINAPFTKRKIYHVTQKAKEIYFKYAGKYNLIVIDMILTQLMREKVDFDNISEEVFFSRYKKLEQQYFDEMGERFN